MPMRPLIAKVRLSKVHEHRRLGLLYYQTQVGQTFYSNYSVNPLSREEKLAFLQRFNEEDERDCDELWSITSTPGLLDASQVPNEAAVLNKKRKEYLYDPKSGQYRYKGSGRLVPERILRNDISTISNKTRNDMRELALKLKNGTISLKYWYNQSQKVMKAAYLNAWLVNIGGKKNFDAMERLKFAEFIQKQFLYFDRLLIEIQTGKQPLNGFFVNRAGMYGSATRAIYQNKRRLKMIEQGYKYGRRIRTAKESCVDCIAEARRGIIRIERMLPIGDSICRSNCHCYQEFYKERPK